MKAKQYAERFHVLALDHGEQEAMYRIVKQFAAEYDTIRALRRPRTVDGHVAILRELDEKWRALCRLLPDQNLSPDGYKRLIQKYHPKAWEIWQRSDQELKLARALRGRGPSWRKGGRKRRWTKRRS